MSVKNIDQVDIPGFGGYSLYSFDYSPGFADSYGTIDVEFINKTGEYDEESLSDSLEDLTFFPITIKTGNGVTNSFGRFIIISYEIVKNGDFKILKVKFADESIQLNRFLVALRGQVGYDSVALGDMYEKEQDRILSETESSDNALFDRVIWVGTSDEACKEDILDELNQDPCDPCEALVNNDIVNKISCDDYYLNRRRRYNYSFSELLTALNSSGIGLTFSIEGSFEDYKFEYLGNAREVLNNICSELGLTFFYKPSSGTSSIKIIDIRAGISINLKNAYSIDNRKKVISDSNKKSREGSKDVFGAASFVRDSEEKKYGCALNSCQKLRMKPFTIQDLFGNSSAHFSEDDLLKNEPRLQRMFEFYCTLTGRVGPEFRDMFLWHHGYDFTTARKLETSGLNKTLKALNGMTIKKVFWSEANDLKSQMLYNLIRSLLTGKDFDAAKDFTLSNRTYFFLAKVDPTKNSKIHNVEGNICNSFFGKYWIRRFKQYWGGIGYNAISPDGDSVRYVDFRSPISLPFADIVLEATGSLENSPLLERDPNGFGDSIAEGDTPDTLRARDTFYLMERTPKFYPTGLSEPILASIQKNVAEYSFKEISIPTDLNNHLEGLGINDYTPETYKVFMVNELGDQANLIGLTISFSSNPDEQDNVAIPVGACNTYTSYGLDDNNTVSFSIKFKDSVFDLMMPVQSHCILDGDQAHDGYTIIIERSGNDTSVVIPKTEIFSYGTHAASNNLSIEFNSYNATTNDLRYLTKTQDASYCQLDKDGVKALLDDLSSLLNYSQGASEEVSLKIEGVPYDFYNVSDGLKSISISIGSSGLSTNISFSDVFPFRLSPDNFLKKLRYQHLKQVQESYAQGSIPKTTTMPEIP